MTNPKTKQLGNFLAFLYVSVFLLCLLFPTMSWAAFTKQINYQGKLTDTAGDAVADGDYDLEFKLYTALTGGSLVWTETRTGADQVTVTDGLFSVMLGEVSSLDAIDFDQPLYLSVNFNGDGEMSPRKILGAVAAAFEANNALTFDGFATTSFLRADQTNASATITNASTTNLTISGTAYLSSLASTMLAVDATGKIIATSTGVGGEVDPVFTASFAFGIASSTNWDTAFDWGNHASAGYLAASSFNGLFDTRLEATTSLPYLSTLAGLATIGSSTGQTTILGKTITTNASTTNLTIATDAYLTSLGSTFLAVNQSGRIIATTTPVLTEADPIFISSFAYGIASSTNWDTAFNWGNHATAGYLTNTTFDTRLAATTSLPYLSTLAGLATIGSSTGQTTILGKTITTNASTTNLTIATDAYLTALGSAYLSVNQAGRIIATTTPVLTESDPVWTSEKASYVPYTGATTGVNLGANTLTLTGKFSGALASTTALTVSGQSYLIGNVGIGTTSPTMSLAVSGYGYFAGDLTATNIIATGTLSVFGNQSIGLGSDATNYISLAGSRGFFGYITGAPGLTTIQSGSGKDIQFRVNSGTFGGGTQALVIKSDGKIGIGTTTPSNALEVNGNGYLSGNLTTGEFNATSTSRFGSFIGTSGALSLASSIMNIVSPTVANTTTYTPETILRLVRNGTSGNKYNLSADFLIGSYNNTINSQTQVDLKLGNGASHTPDTTVMTWLGSGRVGIGTTTPQSALHISQTGNTYLKVMGTTGAQLDLAMKGTHSWRLDNNSHFNIYHGANELTFSDIYFSILNTGEVGIKNATPAYDLDVTGYGRFTTELYVGDKIGIGTNTPAYALDVVGLSNDVARFRNASLNTGCTLTPGGNGIITCTSDSRLKKNIESLDQNLEKILALEPVTYNWLKEGDNQTKSLGFIAQEVEKIIPSLVATDDDGYKSLSTIGMIPLIVGAIQEQQAQIQALALSVGQNLAGQVLDKIEAVAGVFEKLKTKWLEVEEGITIKDRATGNYYCLYFENGVQKSLPGRCDDVLTTPILPVTATPTSEVVPESPPVEPEPTEESLPVEPEIEAVVEPLDESLVVDESEPVSEAGIAPIETDAVETEVVEANLTPTEPTEAPILPALDLTVTSIEES